MAKTGPTFTTDEYSQPLITSFSFPPASLRDLRLTFPPCRYLKRPSSPRETEEERERERRGGGLGSYFGERVRPRKPRFPSSLSPRCFHFNTRIRLFVNSLPSLLFVPPRREPLLDTKMKCVGRIKKETPNYPIDAKRRKLPFDDDYREKNIRPNPLDRVLHLQGL